MRTQIENLSGKNEIGEILELKCTINEIKKLTGCAP